MACLQDYGIQVKTRKSSVLYFCLDFLCAFQLNDCRLKQSSLDISGGIKGISRNNFVLYCRKMAHLYLGLRGNGIARGAGIVTPQFGGSYNYSFQGPGNSGCKW